MPMLLIRTNQSLSVERGSEVLKAASALCAELLGKSENYVMTTLETESQMTFAGSEAPCAYLELKSLGLQAQEAPRLSQALCRFVSERLDVPPERVYIEFTSPERALWGWNGRTFGP